MKIVVINLKTSLNRRALMQSNFDRLGIEFEFFRGIDAWNGEHLYVSRHDESASILDHGKPLTIGEVGCFASHYLLWQRCAMAREPFVILEDDVIIPDEFGRALPAVRELIGRLRLIRLGLFCTDNPYRATGASHGFEIVQYFGPYIAGTQGYAVAPEAAASLVAHAALWSLPVDFYMSGDERHGVHSFGIHPLPVKHADQAAYPSVVGYRQEEQPSAHSMSRIKFQIMQFLGTRMARSADARVNPAE